MDSEKEPCGKILVMLKSVDTFDENTGARLNQFKSDKVNHKWKHVMSQMQTMYPDEKPTMHQSLCHKKMSSDLSQTN